jgi:hypothetical protein
MIVAGLSRGEEKSGEDSQAPNREFAAQAVSAAANFGNRK